MLDEQYCGTTENGACTSDVLNSYLAIVSPDALKPQPLNDIMGGIYMSLATFGIAPLAESIADCVKNPGWQCLELLAYATPGLDDAAGAIDGAIDGGIDGMLDEGAFDTLADDLGDEADLIHPIEGSDATAGDFIASMKQDTEDIANEPMSCLTPASVGLNSFSPDTPVLLANGATKPIKDIKVGDQVEATDPVTGLTEAEPVTQLHDNHDTDLTDLTLRTPSGPTVLHTTQNHPFWNADTHRWTLAGRLTPGTTLYTNNGMAATVVAVRNWTSLQDMRNLTISLIHTYYVIAGMAPILVHNIGECPVTGLPHGALGEAATLDRMQSEGYTDIVPQVRFKNSQGQVFVADYVARNPNGDWVAVEVKTGNGAKISGNQAVGYPELESTGAVLDTTRLGQYGLAKGDTVAMPVEIDLWECSSCS